MTHIPFINAQDIDHNMRWEDVLNAIIVGHLKPKADIGDMLLKQNDNSMLNRAAWIPGLGLGLKTVTIFPDNPQASPPIPSVHGVVILYDSDNGTISAIIDGIAVTKWKTAGDSMLGARYLARPDSRNILIMGSGTLARSLVEAYHAIFPDLEDIFIWSRNSQNADQLSRDMAELGFRVQPTSDLPQAAGKADIISTATLSATPILLGQWITPGTHVDLIGAFRPDMRETDDTTLQKARIFVDSRQTTIHHIGELMIPIAAGVITEKDILGDFYDLCSGMQGRTCDQDITVFKNGGGAHLDLMTAGLMWDIYRDNKTHAD